MCVKMDSETFHTGINIIETARLIRILLPGTGKENFMALKEGSGEIRRTYMDLTEIIVCEKCAKMYKPGAVAAACPPPSPSAPFSSRSGKIDLLCGVLEGTEQFLLSMRENE